MANGRWQMGGHSVRRHSRSMREACQSAPRSLRPKWQIANGRWQIAKGHICQGTLQLRPFLSTVGQQSPKQSTNERNQVMAKYQHFEELPVWQEAARLYNAVLDLLEEPGVPLTPGFR